MRLLIPLPFDVSDLAHGRNLRVVNLVAELQHRAEITVLIADPMRESGIRSHLPAVNIRVINSGRSAGSSKADVSNTYRVCRSVGYFDSTPQLTEEMASHVRDFDGVVGFDLSSSAALLTAKLFCPDTPAIIDLIDDPWLTWRSTRLLSRITKTGLTTAVALRRARKLLLAQMDAVIAAGPRDAASLSASGAPHVDVIANGVKVEPAANTQTHREPLAVMTGFMSFPPNERAALFLIREIWPRVCDELFRRGYPTCRLAIVGADPTPRIEREARSAGIVVTGRVASVREWLLRARLAIAPMQSGSGIKNKLLEACACGCPVVTTTLGASGLPAGEKSGILTADSAESLAHTCADLLRHPDRAARLGEAARQTMQSSFTWSAMANQLFEIIQQQVDGRRIAPITPRSTLTNRSHAGEEVMAHAFT